MKTIVVPLLPVPIPQTDAYFARGIRAGRWIFATGLSGTDYIGAMAPEVVQADHPLNGEGVEKREARRLFQNAAEVLAAGGAKLSDVVRIDQYYTSPTAVPPYHEVRREVFKGKIPPSTSNLHRRFLRRGQTQEVQIMAVSPGAGLEARHAEYNPLYEIHHSSGYSPGLAAGDYRFVPGQTAECRDHAIGGVDPEARVPPGLWKGTPIKAETDFVIQKKLIPSLQAAGAALDTVVCAQVYLRDRADVPGFNEVWHSYFKNPPATTIIATETPGFIVPEERIEINTISLAQAGATKAVAIDSGVPALFQGQVNAVKAGDLLFLSGLMGLEGGKLVAGAAVDERQPFFGIPIKAEMKSILRQAGTICAAAGTSLKNSVRIQLFFANLADLPASLEVLRDVLEGAPLPFSAIEVPWLPVPNARVLASFWVHAGEA